MCGIFGFGFLNGHEIKSTKMMQEIVRQLFITTEERGRTASGIAYTSLKDIHVAKNALKATEFLKTDQFKELEKLISFTRDGESRCSNRLMSVIGHCRQMTKGTELNNVNNHPIVRNTIVGVHNGVIINDDQTFDNYRKTVKRNGEVDSEALFAFIEYFSDSSKDLSANTREAIIRTLQLLKGSASCAFVDRRHPGLVWLFKRSTPADVVMFEKVGVVAWASKKEYIYKAVSDYFTEFGAGKEIEYPTDSGICLDLFRNKISKFKLQ